MLMSPSLSLFTSGFRFLRLTGSARFIAMALLLLLGSRTSLAQAQAAAQVTNTGDGSVAGTVTDPKGAAIAGATVVLKNVENATEEQTTSDETGSYAFPSVLPGSYILTIRATGFSTGDSAPFAIAENVDQRIDVPLQVKGSTETVEVHAGGTNLQTDTSERGQVMEQTEIQSLPLNSREYTDLVLVNPGATASSLETNPIQPRRGSIHIDGMRSSVNNFLLDGLDNNSYQNSNLGYNNQTITPSQDAIQEITIITTNYPAEYGRSGGSIVNTVSRSGTDRLRLSLWEYFRDTALSAYAPLYETGHKPQLSQNQFGGTLGGPVFRDKLFFFLNEESYRIYNSTYALSTLPSMQQRQGAFFDQTGLPIPITNPYTDVTYSDGRLPSTDITPFAAAVLAALPAPTNNSEFYNYVDQANGQNTRDLVELRLDGAIGPHLRIFTRYSQQMNHIIAAASISGPAGGYGNGHIYSVTNQLSMGASYTPTPSALLDFRFGVTRADSGSFPYNYKQTSFYTTLDIPYPIAPQVGSVSLNTQAIGDITTLGTDPTTYMYEDPFTVEPKLNYTLQHGQHTFGLGYDLLVLKTPTAWQSPVYGEDTYDQHFSETVDAPATSTVGNESYYIADFMYGARSQYELSNYSRLTQNARFHSMYAEDNWRLAPRLTLNYGLRYELTVPDYESRNHLANFDPTTVTLKLAQNGSYASRSLVDMKTLNFAPRFGFAYTLFRKLLWHGGYGLSYIQFNRTPDLALEYNGPYSITTIVQQLSPANLCPADSESYTCFRPTMQGYPTSMTSPVEFSTSQSESYYIPKDSPTGYVQSYYYGFQYQTDSHSVLDVAYVGSRGVHVRVLGDYNQAPPVSVANEGSLMERRPIQNFADIWTGLSAGFLKYNSLQVKFQERWKHFFLINSFTWSQARDNASGDQEAANGDAAIVNYDNIKGDAGISGYNQPLNDSAALTWTLPRFAHRKPLLRAIANEWRINVINHITSGLPLNLYWAPNTAYLTTNIGYRYRPDIIGNPQSILNPKSMWQRLGGGQYIGNVLNSNLVSEPSASVLYGNSPRNSIRFVPIWNMDVSVFKDFDLHHQGILEFRAEAFNAPNKTNWSAPDTDISSGAFGYIDSALAPRQFQLAVHYTR